MKFDNLQEAAQRTLIEGYRNLKESKSKKSEDYDFDKIAGLYNQGTTELEKAFTTEVKYWLQTLIDENSNDEIGQKAIDVVDNDEKVKSIVDELVNNSDDLWEEIHLRIEELAGINYRDSIRNK